METHSVKVVSQYATVNGLRVHARVSVGLAPARALPIILVHGLTVSSRYMVPVIQCLAPYHNVFAPDMPGFGKSAPPSRVLTIPELADSLVAWMQVCNIPTAAFMGQSMGCQVIADLAFRHPSRLAAAVLIGPSMDRHGRTALEQARRLCIDGTRTPPTSVLIMLRDFLDCGPRRTLKTLQYALRDKIELKLPHVMAPTLIMRGERDPVASQEWVEELAESLPNGRLQLIAGVSHATQYIVPETTARVVRAFVQNVPHTAQPLLD